MQEARFRVWLEQERKLEAVGARLANCRRVERFEGDLNTQYDADRLAGLIDRLTYTREDERYRTSQKHKVPINGNVYEGTATLKSAVRLYQEFRREGVQTASSTGAPAKRRTQERRNQRPGAHWPDWPQPNDEDLLALARATAPFIRFLDPRIVGAVVEDNRRHGPEWRSALDALGVDPDIYLWEGSPCAFPGIRRYAGSTEIAVFRKRATPDSAPPHCLALDDNDYPKHLWAFIFTDKPFRKKGPTGYQLAHLLDHKKAGNRWRDELVCPSEPPLPYGLFTSAANAIYVPAAFLRPTDFSTKLRNLVQRRAQQLYGDVCRLVPPPFAVRPSEDSVWALDNFPWSAPVGNMDRVLDFLGFRRERMGELIDERNAAR